jgi:hypothetical protein
MRLSELNRTARIFAEIEKPNRFLSSLVGPSSTTSTVQGIIDHRVKQDRMLGLARPSMLEQIVTGQARRERLLRNVTEPTAGEWMMGQLELTDRLVSSSVLDQISRQQRIFDDLARRTTLLQTLVTGSASLPSELIGSADRYREDLQDEVAEEIAVVDLPTAVPDVLGRLADEREAILVCLKRIGCIGAAGQYFGVQIPPVVLGLVIVFLVIGEVADEILTERAGGEAEAA